MRLWSLSESAKFIDTPQSQRAVEIVRQAAPLAGLEIVEMGGYYPSTHAGFIKVWGGFRRLPHKAEPEGLHDQDEFGGSMPDFSIQVFFYEQKVSIFVSRNVDDMGWEMIGRPDVPVSDHLPQDIAKAIKDVIK